MELVFESAHQPLKHSVTRKKGHSSHIFAVEQCVGNDWQGRLAVLSRAERENIDSKRGIRRLLLGEEEDLLHEERHAEFTKNCDEILEKLFNPSVRKQFSKSSMVANFCASNNPYWKARIAIDVELVASKTQVELTLLSRVVRLSKRWLKALYPSFAEKHAQRDLAVRLNESARRLKMTTFGTQVGKPYGHDTIHASCALVVHLDPRKAKRRVITTSLEDTCTRPLFFVVVAILEREDELPWAIGVKCTKRGKILQRSAPLSDDSFQLLHLSSDVRRVGLYHACHEDSNQERKCTVHLKQRIVKDSESLLGGGPLSLPM